MGGDRGLASRGIAEPGTGVAGGGSVTCEEYGGGASCLSIIDDVRKGSDNVESQLWL